MKRRNMSSCIIWKVGKPALKLIGRLKKANNRKGTPREGATPPRISLRVEQHYLQTYMSLPKDTKGELLEAISQAHVDHVTFSHMTLTKVPAVWGISIDNDLAETLDLFCISIGSNKNIKAVTIKDNAPEVYQYFFRRLQHVTSVNISGRSSHMYGNNLHALALSLEGHPSIHTIQLEVQPRYYPDLAKSLPMLPKLKRVVMTRDEVPFILEDAQGIAQVLQAPTPAEVVLDGFKLSIDTWNDIVCNGIECCNVGGLHIKQCRLDHVRIVDQSEEDFYSDLADVLPYMGHLEELQCGAPYKSFSPDDLAFTNAMSNIAVGAGECLSMKKLSLFIPCFTSGFGDALAECLTANSTIEVIDLRCYLNKKVNTRCSSPSLVKATLKNIVVQRISFRDTNLCSRWDPNFERELEPSLRLNSAGRKYIALDPRNQHVGFCVLAQVNDSLDCLYIHLRENPLLCTRGQTIVVATKRRAATVQPFANRLKKSRR
ncbi:hypothetical protein MPSEU_000853500 [Mayamaea pseudoterrestris]|nr:hypothetical protein MPSEU_000853500 [Mayamaea pseudoterrestris]